MMTDLAACQQFLYGRMELSNVLESNVGMEEDGSAKDRIHSGVQGSSCKGRYSQRYKGRCYQPVNLPSIAVPVL